MSGENQISAQGSGRVQKVCLGVVTGAIGIKGEVRVKSYMDDPASLKAYGTVETQDGSQAFKIISLRMVKEGVAVRLDKVETRDAAIALKGTELYVDRARLPEAEEDEFYHADLIGLIVRDLRGQEIGHVTAVFDFGAGDLMEFADDKTGKKILIPFNEDMVPEIEMQSGFVVIDPYEGLMPEDKKAK